MVGTRLGNRLGFYFGQPQRCSTSVGQRAQAALIILSPPCRTFSSLRYLSDHKRSRDVVEREQKEGLEHLRRAPGGAHGVRGSFSSQVGYVCFWIGHQRPDASPQAHMLLTNIETLAIHLGRRCEGRHPQHQPLIGGRAAAAAIYTDQFVDSILRALRR